MLHSSADLRALAIARIVIFGLWWAIVTATPLHLLSELPHAIARPPGLLQLLPAAFWDFFLQAVPLTLFRVALTFSLSLVLVGAKPFNLLAVVTVCGLLLFDGTLKTYGGFISHSHFSLLYVAALLSITPSGERLCVRMRFARSSRPLFQPIRMRMVDPGAVLRLGAFIVAVPYALIGFQRLLLTGTSIFIDDSLPKFVLLRNLEPSEYSFSFGLLLVASPLLIAIVKLAFVAVTLAEITSPLVPFDHRVRRIWLAIIVPFHFFTLLTMNIFFWQNLILIALLFTEFPTRATERWRMRTGWTNADRAGFGRQTSLARSTSMKQRGELG